MLIEDHIFIACPVSSVWEETIDIDMWPHWAPTVQTAQRLGSGPFGLGSEAHIKQPFQPETIWCVTAYEAGNSFAWETTGKLFRMRAAHRVAPQIKGTDCTLSIELTGSLARPLGPLLKPLLGIALKQENKGLKVWCEERHASAFAAQPDPRDCLDQAACSQGAAK